jgi:hypothetical protein
MIDFHDYFSAIELILSTSKMENERIEPLLEIECRYARTATPLGLCVGERLLDVASARQGGRVLG